MTTPPRTSPFSLIYRAAGNSLPAKRGIEDTYKTIRNRLRKYSAASIVDLTLQMMWNPPADPLDELRSAPWLTMLVAKWALQDRSVSLRVGPKIPNQEMDRIRQELWELQGKPDIENVFLMLRSLLHVQVEFQRKESWGFLRLPALYARLPNGHKCRQQFRLALGMEPNAFLDLAYSLYAAVMNKRMPFGSNWLSPWRSTYGEAVDRIFEIFGRDLPGLRDELQKEAAQKIRGKHELYEFPYFKRFPLLRQRDGTFHCWHPLVFARGIEEVVHLRLSEQFGKDYADSFSRVFEDYVTELAVETGVSHLVESVYKGEVGSSAPSVEVILEGDDCNIFVEAKMSLFADDVFLQDSQKAIFNKTKRVRDGISQGWRVGRLIREHPTFGSRFQKAQDFLLVVTSRELNIGSGEMLQRLYAPDAFGYPDEDAARRLPLTNVFVLGIEEFENVIGCVRAGEVDLSALLKEAAIANQKGETARMFLTDFLGKYTKQWTRPKVLEAARHDSEARTLAAFQDSAEVQLAK